MKSKNQKKPIRVLMLFTILNRGGAESVVMNYYRKIDRNIVQFDFVVHREEKGAFEDEITELGGRIFRMPPLRPYNLIKYKRMIADFFDTHPYYNIIHGQCSESGYFFYKEASRRDIPIIIAHAHSSHVRFDLKWPFRTLMKHLMRPYITHCFACSEESALWLFGKSMGKKAIVMKNAIDTELFRFSTKTRINKRKELGIAEDVMVVCHVGRFNKVKNHTFVIDIFNEIRKIRQNAILLLIGEGQLRSKMEQKAKRLGIENKIEFLGLRNDINQLLQTADIFLFPSLFEGLGLCLIEAQCCGLPCIISDIIPNEVVVTDLVRQMSLSENPRKWAIKAIEVAEKQFDRESYPPQLANAGYDIKNNAKLLQNFYLKAVPK